MKVELTSTKLSFSGENKFKKYALELELYAEIDETLSKTHHSGRGIEFVLRKKEIKSEYWPRLSKEPKKLQFIKTDFDKVCNLSCPTAGNVKIIMLTGIHCSGSMRMSRMMPRTPPRLPTTTWTTWTTVWVASISPR